MSEYYGISLDNDFSCIYSAKQTNSELLLNEYGKISSMILSDGNDIHVGNDAQDNSYGAGGNQIPYTALIPELGSKFRIGKYSAKDIVSMLIRSLVKSRKPFAKSCVITVPTCYDSDKRHALVEACMDADLKIEAILDNTMAVFNSYLFDNKSCEDMDNILVLSLGKRSFDLGIIAKENNDYQLQPTINISQKDWDGMLMACNRYNDLNDGLMHEYLNMCKSAVSGSGRRITKIILTGDYSINEVLQNAVAKQFGIKPVIYNSDGMLAKGAAIFASNFSENRGRIAISLGTNVDVGGEAFVDNIILRNTKMPCQASAEYKVIDNQEHSMSFEVSSNGIIRRCVKKRDSRVITTFKYDTGRDIPEDAKFRVTYTVVEPTKLGIKIEGVNCSLDTKKAVVSINRR